MNTFTPDPLVQSFFNKHLTALTKKYSKLLPLRIDFHYATSDIALDPRNGLDICFPTAQNDIKRLLNKVKQEVKHFVGYAFVMEISKNQNIHFHAIVYINGQYRQKYYPIYKQITEIWKSTVDENAYTYDCNKNDYKFDTLKVFSHNDKGVLTMLNYLFGYMSKIEQKEDIDEEFKYDVSDVPEPSTVGRPRKQAN